VKKVGVPVKKIVEGVLRDMRYKSDLTPRQLAVLVGLQEAEIYETGPEQDGWCRPMDVGGRDASGHSEVLIRLVALGFAQRRRRGGSARASYLYHITPAGHRVLNDRRRQKGGL